MDEWGKVWYNVHKIIFGENNFRELLRSAELYDGNKFRLFCSA